MKSWDVIVLGCGVIGASLARELHKSGAHVLVIERGEPGREATHAAAGMLAPTGGDLPQALQGLALESAKIYPEFVRELEDEAASAPHVIHTPKIDLRSQGSLLLEMHHDVAGQKLNRADLQKAEPELAQNVSEAVFLKESSVDPRGLMAALLHSLKHRGVDLARGSAVRRVSRARQGGFEVETEQTTYAAGSVVNCCGAWSGGIEAPVNVPSKPRKGQMLSVIAPQPLLQHVVRSEEVYIVPRSDGRILIGATVEDVGFDKRVRAETIKDLQKKAEHLVPALTHAKIHENWAGLRPGTPDDLPILGQGATGGYFVATGHFRNGILLAPITARVMSRLIRGEAAGFALDAFSPARFA
ncbi:MAG: glycine oxidase ThiO [Terriglobales bacterium]